MSDYQHTPDPGPLFGRPAAADDRHHDIMARLTDDLTAYRTARRPADRAEAARRAAARAADLAEHWRAAVARLDAPPARDDSGPDRPAGAIDPRDLMF